MGNIHFRNQHAIGNYIVDFCAPRKKLIIELDGSQHLEQQEYDDERTKYLEAHGYRVLRFWNHDVINHIDDVLRVIWSVLKDETGDETKKTPDSAGSDWSSLAFNTLLIEWRE